MENFAATTKLAEEEMARIEVLWKIDEATDDMVNLYHAYERDLLIMDLFKTLLTDKIQDTLFDGQTLELYKDELLVITKKDAIVNRKAISILLGILEVINKHL